MIARLTAAAALHSLALRRHLRTHRIGQVAHYLVIIGVVVLLCVVIGLVMLAVSHRRGKPGPE